MNKKRNRFSQDDILNQICGEPYSLKEVQNSLLEMMKAFDSFCNRNNIPYFLCGGTLLGAVRHKGFIPWDDDVDILIPRKEYERLLSFDKITNNLEVISYKNDHGYYHPYPYCNIADKNTIMVEHNSKHPTGKGLFLDIFPLDNVPENDKQRERFYRKLTFYKYLKGIPTIPYKKSLLLKDLLLNILSLVLSILDEMSLAKKIDILARKYENNNSRLKAMVYIGNVNKQTFPSNAFVEYINMKFEEYDFHISKKYDLLLKIQYGDYLKLPPIEERIGHHGVEIYKRNQL